MFKSFFPKPKWFFSSLVIYAALSIFIWYSFHKDIGGWFGLDMDDSVTVIGLGHFVTNSFILFYGYYIAVTALFAGFWMVYSPNKWQLWSILGSSLILFSTYYSVQVSVAINNWYRPFFNSIQGVLAQPSADGNGVIQPDRNSEEIASIYSELFDHLVIFAEIVFIYIVIIVLTRFFVSHFIFRWRTAMNEYYTEQWPNVRHIEGASQRIQEDTMRFSTIMENLGVSMVDAIMTLFAFLPVLWTLSEHVHELPIVGDIPQPLFFAALFWALFGTTLLALVGIKLPGLEFKNQRVEAAFRKELVYGEDDENRAQPIALRDLFSNVRRNYFKLYFHYMYFNIFRYMYLQADNIFVMLILIPTFAVGAITLGIFQQISSAFGQVSSSLQYLVNSWTTIVELISVYKRLLSFEAAIKNEELPEIDRVNIDSSI